MLKGNIIITESLIIYSIKELSSNYPAGPDGIPASLLLNCNCLRFQVRYRTVSSNNRPISLTSVIIIVTFIISNGHLNPTQQGFQGGRSCLSALIYDIMIMVIIEMFIK